MFHRGFSPVGGKGAARIARGLIGGVVLIGMGMVAGCGQGWLSPHEMGRFRSDPLLMPILQTLDVGYDMPEERYVAATDVQPEDLEVIRRDYRIGRNDLVNVEVTDLLGPGVGTVVTKRVTESGMISLPLVGQVEALGLTEAQLEQRIVEAYREAQIIQNAQVAVTVVEQRARTFSVLGAVTRPGQYAIMDADMRVLDALVLAGDAQVVGVDFMYIIRRPEEDLPEEPADAPERPIGPEDLLEPRSQRQPAQRVVMLQVAPGDDLAPRQPNGQQPVDVAPAQPAEPGVIRPDEDRQIIIEGQRRPLAEQPPAAQPDVAPAPEEPFEFADPLAEGEMRIIRVPLNALRRGDLRYNIVIRPNDMIVVPQPVIGEYYMGGHVMRPGVYSLTGRNITIKQAVISAGMLDGLAIPSRTDIVRRIGDDREVIVRLQIDRIFAGQQPDVFLRPDDQILVGTDWYAPFLAAARGAFRLTYGFGFIWDRNFAVDRQRQFN